MIRLIKIILTILAICILIYVFGSTDGGYSDALLYIIIIPIIWIFLHGLKRSSIEDHSLSKDRFFISKISAIFILSGFFVGGLVLLIVYFFLNSGLRFTDDIYFFGYIIFFIFFISLIGLQIDKKYSNVRNFFKGSIFMSLVGSIILVILLKFFMDPSQKSFVIPQRKVIQQTTVENKVITIQCNGENHEIENVQLLGVNIARVVEDIGKKEDEFHTVCSNINVNSSNTIIGIATKKTDKKDIYLIYLYRSDDAKGKNVPFEQVGVTFKFDFNQREVYFQSQYDGTFASVGSF